MVRLGGNSMTLSDRTLKFDWFISYSKRSGFLPAVLGRLLGLIEIFHEPLKFGINKCFAHDVFMVVFGYELRGKFFIAFVHILTGKFY